MIEDPEFAVEMRAVPVNGITLNVAIAGTGPAILLLHGWPHTWMVWKPVIERLAGRYRVIAPDLRGIGGSSKAAEGYDLDTLSDDMVGLLDALEVETVASAVALDAGVGVAFMLAMRYPSRVERLIVMEGLLGTLPGAEAFLRHGKPWWFGFHAVPHFAEDLLAGREWRYLDYFYVTGTAGGRGVRPEARAAFVDAYSQPDAMRCGFEYYRAMPEHARQIEAIVARQRLRLPTLAIGGGAVGPALHGQLRAISDDLHEESIPDCGHIVPQDQPEALGDVIARFTDGNTLT